LCLCPTSSYRLLRGLLCWWVQFDLDSDIAQMEWVGATGQVIFALSVRGLLYRSGDSGNSWTNETALGKLKGMDLPTSADLFDRGGIASIVFEHGNCLVLLPSRESPIASNEPPWGACIAGRPEEVFFVGHGGHHWATLDKGDSYVQPCGVETAGDLCVQHPAPGQTLSPPFVKFAHAEPSASLDAMISYWLR
jgi:hypothetical protein